MLAAAVFNTLLLAMILVRFARTPIRDFLIQRSRAIARAVEATEARLLEASVEVQRWRSRLSRVGEETTEMLRLAGESAEAERARRLERGRQAAQRIRLEASELAEREIVEARDALRTELAELSAGLAASLLRQSLRPEDDRRLVADYVQRIGAAQ
jgi:F0F1-type ATP synthase membrane subunit b/b'